MAEFSDISVVIPVREGSSRIEQKIFLPFHDGLNLLEWKIEQVKSVQTGDRIFISSNSERVKETALRHGVSFLPRSEYLSVGHQASFSEVITGIVQDVPTDHFAWITVVVPLMKPDDYADGFRSYLEKVVGTAENDSLIAVNLLKEYFWDRNGPLNYQADKNHTISQELPDLYRVTNGLYMRSKKATMEEGYFIGKNPVLQEVSKVAGIDIDLHEDYLMALALKSMY